MSNKKGNTISAESAKNERAHMIASNMNFAASEAYKTLRTNLMFSFSDTERCHIIGMTSPFRGEGKTLTSINLAFTMAEAGKKVLLIEGDMRLPTLATRLGLKTSPGLSNLMVGMNSAKEAVQTYETKRDDGKVIRFGVIVSGDIPPNPSEILGSKRMQSLLNVVKDMYEYVIIDLPPVTMVTDALVASKIVDGLVVVVRSKKAVRGALEDTMRQLKLVDARILGFVFNGASESGGSYYKGKNYYKKNYYYYKK